MKELGIKINFKLRYMNAYIDTAFLTVHEIFHWIVAVFFWVVYSIKLKQTIMFPFIKIEQPRVDLNYETGAFTIHGSNGFARRWLLNESWIAAILIAAAPSLFYILMLTATIYHHQWLLLCILLYQSSALSCSNSDYKNIETYWKTKTSIC